MTPKPHLQLSPQHGAVVLAHHRIMAHIALEASQLADCFDQKGAASFLTNIVASIQKENESFCRSVMTGLVVATEIPSGIINGVK